MPLPTAAQTRDDENQLRTSTGGFEGGKLLLRQGAPAVGIAAGTESSQQIGLQMNLHRGRHSRKGGGIRVDGGEGYAGKFRRGQRAQQGGAGHCQTPKILTVGKPGARVVSGIEFKISVSMGEPFFFRSVA